MTDKIDMELEALLVEETASDKVHERFDQHLKTIVDSVYEFDPEFRFNGYILQISSDGIANLHDEIATKVEWLEDNRGSELTDEEFKQVRDMIELTSTKSTWITILAMHLSLLEKDDDHLNDLDVKQIKVRIFDELGEDWLGLANDLLPGDNLEIIDAIELSIAYKKDSQREDMDFRFMKRKIHNLLYLHEFDFENLDFTNQQLNLFAIDNLARNFLFRKIDIENARLELMDLGVYDEKWHGAITLLFEEDNDEYDQILADEMKSMSHNAKQALSLYQTMYNDDFKMQYETESGFVEMAILVEPETKTYMIDRRAVQELEEAIHGVKFVSEYSLIYIDPENITQNGKHDVLRSHKYNDENLEEILTTEHHLATKLGMSLTEKSTDRIPELLNVIEANNSLQQIIDELERRIADGEY